jgi:hypothetical protein
MIKEEEEDEFFLCRMAYCDAVAPVKSYALM